MLEVNDFNAVRISLASPEQIKGWSYGEVTKPETINYRTLKPEKDGLFCEKIFGPTKDFECYCGKYKRVRYKGIICDKCGVEVARSKVRRERMGHINLASPVSHIWFVKGTPSRLGLILDMSPRSLERILYFAQYVITGVDEERRDAEIRRLREELEREVAKRQESFNETVSGAYEALQARLAAIDVEQGERLAEVTREVKDVQGQLTVGQAAAEDIFALGPVLVHADEAIKQEHLAELEERARLAVERVQQEQDQQRHDAQIQFDALRDQRQRQTEEETLQIQQRLKADLDELENLRSPKQQVEDLRPLTLLTDKERSDLLNKFGHLVKVGMGAEAIHEIVNHVDIDALWERLRREVQSTSGQRRKKATKRLRVVEAFRKSGNKPEWMVFTILPVLPPDLRPMVQLDGGRFATSDLNDLYRRVINRNNRLRRLLELGAPEIIIRNEKRMLQEAVDSLIDNGRRGRAVSGSSNHKLKSLSDMLKGKQGRFRQNLLGKRVDYSGRSVIVVGPTLKLHECGLPKRMALELFKPFVMRRLVEKQYAHNIKSAKRVVERVKSEVWDVLEEVIKDRPVLLNRAPTLHRLGIQAFMPVLIDGSAIQIHPLVCAAFNADFDGDQMAVHVPLSAAAVEEAKRLMLSTRNLLLPSSGEPVVAPTLDMVLGCYYMTIMGPEPKDRPLRRFANPEEARLAFELGQIKLHDPILLRPDAERKLIRDADCDVDGKYLKTTIGRLLFNEVLPGDLPLRADPRRHYRNDVMNRGALKDVVADCYRYYTTHEGGNEETARVVNEIKQIGFRYATQSGITIAVSDILAPPAKTALLEGADREVRRIKKDFQRGLITDEERYQQEVEIWTSTVDEMQKDIRNTMSAQPMGSVFLMSNSGAKGNISQISQMAGMRGLMTDPSGKIIELPIRSSFREGLTVLEYFISTHGARKGLADTALRTADSGYLTRRLIDVAQDIIIKEDDCDTSQGITITKLSSTDREVVAELAQARGHYAVRDVADANGEVVVKAGQFLRQAELEQLRAHGVTRVAVYALDRFQARIEGRLPAEAVVDPESGEVLVGLEDSIEAEQVRQIVNSEIEWVVVRSPLTCDARQGLCRNCYGRNAATGQLVQIGDAVGIIAAQSIGEPGTQLTMRTFHTGGVAGNRDITSGLPRVEELFEAREPKPSVRAIISEIGGMAEVVENQGQVKVVVRDRYQDEYDIPAEHELLIRDDEWLDVDRPISRPATAEEDGSQGVPRQALTTGDEILARIAGKGRVYELDGGGRRVVITYEEQREYEVTQGQRIREGIETGTQVKPGDQITEGVVDPRDVLRVRGREAVQLHLVEEVQKVYRSQGVTINDKHIEVIVRNMLRKVQVDSPGDTDLLPGELVDRFLFRDLNEKVLAEGGDPATAKPALLGVTKASLHTDSFLAAASFQETTRVLTEAAINGQVDRLVGLKENVIIGKLIPAGSGAAARARRALEQALPEAGEYEEFGGGFISEGMPLGDEDLLRNVNPDDLFRDPVAGEDGPTAEDLAEIDFDDLGDDLK